MFVESGSDSNIDTSNLTGPRNIFNSGSPQVKTFKYEKTKPIKMHTNLKNSGMMMGDEEAATLVTYDSTACCKSIQGEVYQIRATDFFDMVKYFSQSKEVIDNMALMHLENKYDTYNSIQTIASQEAKLIEKIKNNQFKIGNEEILQEMFFAKKIP